MRYRHFNPLRYQLVCWGLFATWSLMIPTHALAIDIEGFLEPSESIDVSTSESGLVVALGLRIGDALQRGDVVARLDDELHRVELQMARAKADSEGELQAAMADEKLRLLRLQQLQALYEDGDATEEELAQAQNDLLLAQARILAQQEQLRLFALDAEKASIHFERRTVRSPATGIVAAVLAKPGEYVSPIRPELITLVQMDPIVAVFDVPREFVRQYRRGDQVTIRIEGRQAVTGHVESVGVLMDAASRTTKLKVSIPNSGYGLHSGESCTLTTSPAGGK